MPMPGGLSLFHQAPNSMSPAMVPMMMKTNMVKDMIGIPFLLRKLEAGEFYSGFGNIRRVLYKSQERRE